MSKTLEDLKEAMAKEEGFDTWRDLEYKTNFTSMKILWERLSERYADQRVSEALNSQWVSVKERLPEEDVNVLCYSRSDFVEGYYCSVTKVWRPEIDDIGYMENDIMRIDVSHWQPLLSPPLKP